MRFRIRNSFLAAAFLLILSLSACSAVESTTEVDDQTSPAVSTEHMARESTKESAETVSAPSTETESTSGGSLNTITVFYPDSLAALGKTVVSYINEPERLHELFDYSDMDGAYSLEEATVAYMGRMPYDDEPLYTYTVCAYCYIDDNGHEIEPDGYVFPFDDMAQVLSDLGLVVITGYENKGVYDPEDNPAPRSKKYLVAAPEGLVGEIFQDGGDPIAHWMFRVMPAPLK